MPRYPAEGFEHNDYKRPERRISLCGKARLRAGSGRRPGWCTDHRVWTTQFPYAHQSNRGPE
jgi:hypothetical protein